MAHIFEFSGIPKSGKTTISDIVSHYLRREQNLDVSEFHGGGRYAPLTKKDLGSLNLYLACQAVQHVLVARGPTDRDVHLMDRGLVDRLIFTNALSAMGRIGPDHESAVRGILAAPELKEAVSCTFVFITSSELSLERETRNKLSPKDGRVMNSELLGHLRTAAAGVVEDSLSRRLSEHIVVVDTQAYNGDIMGTAEMVAQTINEIRKGRIPRINGGI